MIFVFFSCLLAVFITQWYLISNHFNIHSLQIITCLMLLVMAMESQAEALGQLATDDLEGKVKLDIAD